MIKAPASSIAEYERVVFSNNFTLVPGITQYASTKITIYKIIKMEAQTKNEIIAEITATTVKTESLKRALPEYFFDRRSNETNQKLHGSRI